MIFILYIKGRIMSAKLTEPINFLKCSESNENSVGQHSFATYDSDNSTPPTDDSEEIKLTDMPYDESENGKYPIILPTTDEYINLRSLRSFTRYYKNYINKHNDPNFQTFAPFNFLLYLNYQNFYCIPNEVYWVSEVREPYKKEDQLPFRNFRDIVLRQDIKLLEQLKQYDVYPYMHGYDTQFAVIHNLPIYLEYLLKKCNCHANKHFSLYLAVIYGSPEILYLLLSAGADAGKQRNFPFALACYYGRFDQAELLLSFGAKTKISIIYLFLFGSKQPYYRMKDTENEVGKINNGAEKNPNEAEKKKSLFLQTIRFLSTFE